MNVATNTKMLCDQHYRRLDLHVTYSEFDKQSVPFSCIFILHAVERRGTGAELRMFDYENPGSNPVLQCETVGKFFSLCIAPVHSAELMSI